MKLVADKAGVHSCAKESSKDRAFWRGGEGGIFNFVISLSKSFLPSLPPSFLPRPG